MRDEHGLNSTKTTAYLGVDTSNLPDLRDVLTDRHHYSPRMLDALMRGKPGHVSRGGGKQNLENRPDGHWLWSVFVFGLLEPDKRQGKRKGDPGGYGAWWHQTTRPALRVYANAAEAVAAWAGTNVNALAAVVKDGRPPAHRPPRWSVAHTCERIPRKPMAQFTVGAPHEP